MTPLLFMLLLLLVLTFDDACVAGADGGEVGHITNALAYFVAAVLMLISLLMDPSTDAAVDDRDAAPAVDVGVVAAADADAAARDA